MFGFGKKDGAEESAGLFSRLRRGLAKTGQALTGGVADLFLGRKTIDDEVIEELEALLLSADVGVEATGEIIAGLTSRVARKELADTGALLDALRESMAEVLRPCAQPLVIDSTHRPFVILVVGVNGAGKTTTIGKLALHLKEAGLSVMLAAGDTFRAAAVEQLTVWGERNDVPVIAQGQGADSASVIHDALHAAKTRGIDVLIADTAGRLHTQSHLMEEMKKIRRVITRIDPSAPHETLLVIDGGTGQNALRQTEEFHQALGVSGIAVTKLDGTARGGVIFAVARRFGIPVRFIGVGEGIEDLREFDADEFVGALIEKG